MAVTKIRKGDLVQMLAGKDRGKQGRVLESRPRERRVIVENLNTVKRHTRPQPMRDSSRMGGSPMTPGGVIEKSAPVPVSNVMLVDPSSNQPTRVALKRDDEGRRVRVAKRSGKDID